MRIKKLRIKKFNEGVDDGFDIEYINLCFAELSDEYDLKMEEVESERKYLQISMDLPRLNSEIVLTEDEVDIRNVYFKFKNTLPNLIKNSEELTKILKLTKISIDRLLDEYPNYAITFKEIDDKFRTKVQYTASTSIPPKLFVTICKK